MSKRARRGYDMGGSLAVDAFGSSIAAGLEHDQAYGWASSPVDPNKLVRRFWKPLVARSRQQSHSDSWVRGFERRVLDNVLGPKGSILRPLYMTDRVSISDDVERTREVPDGPLRKAITKWWTKQYSRKEACHFREQLWLPEIKRAALQRCVRDGDLFIEHVFDDGPYGFRVQIIEPERCPVELNQGAIPARSRVDVYVSMGIGYDQHMRPTAYYFRDKEGDVRLAGGTRLRRVPAERITHIYARDLGEDQRRGLPWVTVALLRAKMLAGLEDAAITKAKSAAEQGGFYEQQGADGFIGDQVDRDDNEVLIGRANEFQQVPTGFELHQIKSDWPRDWAAIEKWNLRAMASGWGIAYFFLAQDYESINFSAGKLGILDEREMWCGLQEWWAREMEVPHFEIALGEALASTGIPGPNDQLLGPADFELLRDVEFQGRRWPSVEPDKEWSANQRRVAMRETSVPELIRARGRDPFEVAQEAAEWEELLAEFGLSMAVPDLSAQSSAVPEDDPEPTNEPGSEPTEDDDEDEYANEE